MVTVSIVPESVSVRSLVRVLDVSCVNVSVISGVTTSLTAGEASDESKANIELSVVVVPSVVVVSLPVLTVVSVPPLVNVSHG